MNNELEPYVVPGETFEERKQRHFREAAELERIEADPELLIKKNVVGAIKTLVEIMDGSFNDRLRIEAAKSLIQLARSRKDEDVIEVEDINVSEIQEQILEILRKKNAEG